MDGLRTQAVPRSLSPKVRDLASKRVEGVMTFEGDPSLVIPD